LARR
jgi:hypothetical protein